MSRILLLSASPIRDGIIDELLSEELTKRGHQVMVKPCLREGRKAILELQPDTVVMPPIRNPYSRDFVEEIRRWGIGIVSRHTEPSCDWQDFKRMTPIQQQQIFGQYPYVVDAELVWSQDEAEILAKRKVEFPVHAIGAVTVDAYKRPDVIAKYRNREAFCAKYKFDPAKKILLICSAWGFADAAPDLHIEDLDDAKRDLEGRDRHLEMIGVLANNIQDRWNILVTIHPGVLQKPYKDLCAKLNLPLDAESRSFDLNIHADGIVHGGSTMAISAHLLGIPAWQFGDINAKNNDSWWGDPKAAISKISPYCKTADELMIVIKNYDKFVSGSIGAVSVTGGASTEVIHTVSQPQGKPGSNANLEALAALEKGRFGVMDGQALVRAAEIIDKVQGKFTPCWPRSVRDYSQLTILRDIRRIVTPMQCGICGEEFFIVNDSWLSQVRVFAMARLEPYLKEKPPQAFLENLFQTPNAESCPHCAARYFRKEVEPQ